MIVDQIMQRHVRLVRTAKAKSRTRRLGFTLVELLVVIMLIGIMASFVLVALAGATATAKEDRTRAQIAKIHELVMTQWEEYQYRRVPTTLTVRKAMQQQGGMMMMDSRTMAQHRLLALRELMRMELPTHRSDVLMPANYIVGSAGSTTLQPAKWRAYRQRVEQAEMASGTTWSVEHQEAECLYLILSQLRDADASALEFFAENEIGDTDADGMKEILDAWGNPICWALWAPGYISPLQVPLSEKLEQHDLFDLSQVGTGYVPANNFANQNVTVNLAGTSVPVNFFQLPRTLYPLVYSFGPDGTAGVIRTTSLNGNVEQNWPLAQNDPYNRDLTLKMFLIGATSVENPGAGADDISNHYLTATR